VKPPNTYRVTNSEHTSTHTPHPNYYPLSTSLAIKEAQRIAVRRFKKYQPDLFGEYNYAFVMTNRGGLTTQEIFDIHSTKSGYENSFKDLLSVLGLHHPRFMKLSAKRLFCQIAAMAYNILKAAKYPILN
jgi:hypothetical protein